MSRLQKHPNPWPLACATVNGHPVYGPPATIAQGLSHAAAFWREYVAGLQHTVQPHKPHWKINAVLLLHPFLFPTHSFLLSFPHFLHPQFLHLFTYLRVFFTPSPLLRYPLSPPPPLLPPSSSFFLYLLLAVACVRFPLDQSMDSWHGLLFLSPHRFSGGVLCLGMSVKN